MRNQRGQLLIESLIAIGLIVVGLLGIFTLLSQSLGLRRVVSERYVGTYLAAEGVELVKNMIDRNYLESLPWNSGLGAGTYEVDYDDSSPQADQSRWLRYDSLTGLYGYDLGNETIFKRLVTISYPGSSGNEMKINSLVSWITRGGGEFSINLEDRFFNWR